MNINYGHCLNYIIHISQFFCSYFSAMLKHVNVLKFYNFSKEACQHAVMQNQS